MCARGGEYGARACVYMNEPPIALGRSSRPFNRSPLVNRLPGGKPIVTRVGEPAGRPYAIAPPLLLPPPPGPPSRDLNVHRSQVAISVDRFWSTVEPPGSGHRRTHTHTRIISRIHLINTRSLVYTSKIQLFFFFFLTHFRVSTSLQLFSLSLSLDIGFVIIIFFVVVVVFGFFFFLLGFFFFCFIIVRVDIRRRALRVSVTVGVCARAHACVRHNILVIIRR